MRLEKYVQRSLNARACSTSGMLFDVLVQDVMYGQYRVVKSEITCLPAVYDLDATAVPLHITSLSIELTLQIKVAIPCGIEGFSEAADCRSGLQQDRQFGTPTQSHLNDL